MDCISHGCSTFPFISAIVVQSPVKAMSNRDRGMTDYDTPPTTKKVCPEISGPPYSQISQTYVQSSQVQVLCCGSLSLNVPEHRAHWCSKGLH
ncbi:hypothetical protein JZ751_029539 [Albula glossodonta]|uniref:Uncharacterized protein n=1 Tax=Albula glossodonta TaxID=121402 RepID=A0A8T2NBC9_9TELE|nr:hypothetical protein JZ751_029539 [Albula glossodonta]